MTTLQEATCKAIVSIFETNRIEGDYGAITNLIGDNDGGCTYGRYQFTIASGSLEDVIRAYVRRVPQSPLRLCLGGTQMILTKLDRAILHNLGRTRNPEMVAAQEEVNDKHYWLPAIGWCDDHGINEALGNAVVYDSFVHGGFGIVRKLFPETPSSGPRHWIKAYVTARHKWLQEHTNTLLHKTVYRMVTFERLIRDNNWDLKLPIHICGIDVTRGALGYDRNEEVADAT